MHSVYVAGNNLVKFGLITDSHLLDIYWLSKLTPSNKGGRGENIFSKRPIKIYLFYCSSW